MSKRFVAVSLAFFALLPLMGCETLGLTSSTPPEAMIVDFTAPCPITAVLGDAALVTKLKPGSPIQQNPANVMFSAEMAQPKLECDYDRPANKLSVNISFGIRAARGAAAQGADPQLSFFVAIVDVDNNVLFKKVFQVAPEMGGKAQNTFTESINNFAVPLAMDKRPPDYEILTGFQLTPEELAYNRAPRPLPAPRANRP
ncbi:MAG TPA: hypothetical protein VEU06_03150 [Micropepsaceae bacterium]|nr:hypothetical protein [Micropepsaceae bacterium]